MINKMKRIILMGAMILGVSFFTSNCALFDPAQNGPSCSLQYLGDNTACLDLIDTDSAAMADFEDDCNDYNLYGSGYYTATYATIGCDLITYDVAGHCEYDDYGYAYAIWYSSEYISDYGYTSTDLESICRSGGGTWVSL
jgi:hypothetical protein